MATIDGKQIVKMLYHAGVKTLLTVEISELCKNAERTSTKSRFHTGDIGMLSIDILLAMATHDMLIKQGIIPPDIIKKLF